MVWKWRNYDGILAKLIPKEMIKGLIKQDIVVRPGEQVIILRDGKIEDTVTQTRLEKIGGGFGNWLQKSFGYGEDLELLFVDTTETDIVIPLNDLSKDHDEVKGDCTLKVRINPSNAVKIVGLMKTFAHLDKDLEQATKQPVSKKIKLFGRVDDEWYTSMVLLKSDVSQKLKGELDAKVFRPLIGQYSSDDVRRNAEVREKMEHMVQIELHKTFEMWGFNLLNFYTTLEAEAYELLEDHRRKMDLSIEQASIDSLPGFMEKIRGIEREFQEEKRIMETAFEKRRMGVLHDEDIADIKQQRDLQRKKEKLDHYTQIREDNEWREHVQDMKELFGEPYLKKYGVPGVLDVKERMNQMKRAREEHEVDLRIKEYQGTEIASKQIDADVQKEKARLEAEKEKYNLDTYKEGSQQKQKELSEMMDKSAKMMQASKQDLPHTLVQGGSQPSSRVNISDKELSPNMSESVCPHCKKSIPKHSDFCPHCGEKLT